jgi:hypothetical protein
MNGSDGDKPRPESSANTVNSTWSTFSRAGHNALKFAGIALLVYVVGMSVFALSQFSVTKSALLSHGLTNATGSLVAWAVMLMVIGLPALATLRVLFFRGRPVDYAAAMLLPLISWAIAQIPANFDATTGEAMKFCATRPDNSLYCSDHAGIDPLTRQKLQPMSPAMADIALRREMGLTPIRITEPVTNIIFFDPLTAQPKVWVYKNDQGCFDLFNNPGAHPQTGELLSPITKELVRQIRQCSPAPAQNQSNSSQTSQPPEFQRRAQLGNKACPTIGGERPPNSDSMPAYGVTVRRQAGPGDVIQYTGTGFISYCIYNDDSYEELSPGDHRLCSRQDIKFQYARDTSGCPNSVTYAAVRR